MYIFENYKYAVTHKKPCINELSSYLVTSYSNILYHMCVYACEYLYIYLIVPEKT